MSDIDNRNQQMDHVQMMKLKEEAEKGQKERSSSARDRLLDKMRDAKSTENMASSRYTQLLSNNQKALSGRLKRLSPAGKSGRFSGSPDQHGALRKSPASPSSAKGRREQRPEQRLIQQHRSINNLRQNLMHPKPVQGQKAAGQRRHETGSQQMRKQCLEEQIMDLEDDAHSGTPLDNEKGQNKRNRSRNQQLDGRADKGVDPKLEPRSVQIELLRAGPSVHASVGQNKSKTRAQGKTQQLTSSKSPNSPGSNRTPGGGSKQAPSSNIFQLGAKTSKSKAAPKTAFSEADQFGHKSQPSNSSLSWQLHTNLRMPASDAQRKKMTAGQVQSNYFVQKRDQEPLKDSKSQAKMRHAASGQAERNRMPSETPEDAERVSTTSGNVFDETRNGLNKAAIQDSSQHTHHLSTQGIGQLQFLHTPLSTEVHDAMHQSRARESNTHPYGAAGVDVYHQLDSVGEQGSPTHLMMPSRQQSLTPGRTSSKFSTSSLCNRMLPQGSAIQQLVSEIRADNCDLCHLQRGLREIDRILTKQGALAESPRPGARTRKQENDWSRQRQQPKPKLLGLGQQSAATTRLQKKHAEIANIGKRNAETERRKDDDKYSDRSEFDQRGLFGSIAQSPVGISASKVIIHEGLCEKYLECDDYVHCKLTSDIMYNETRHIVSVFKDYLIYDDFSEYMKRYYSLHESGERLPRIFSFYAKYSKVYPNYVALPRESRFMFKNIERKQKLIDQRNRRIQEFQEKKAAAERGLKDVEAALDDRGDGSRNAKFNLFSSEFVNNLTELAPEEPTMHDDQAEYGQEDAAGYNGLQSSRQASVNRFQAYQASAPRGAKEQVERSAVVYGGGDRLSQLLVDISLVSRADQAAPGRSQVMMSGATSRALNSQVQNQNGGKVDGPEPDDFRRHDGIAAATVPSISCSFISNRPSMTQPHATGGYSTVDDARARQMIAGHVAVGFDLNATSGDSLKQHFRNEENMAEITSIVCTEGNENRKQNEADDDDGEFEVPSEKYEDQGEASSNFDGRRQAVKNQGLGGYRDGQGSGGSPSARGQANVATARGSVGMQSMSDKKSSGQRQESQPRARPSGRSQQEEPLQSRGTHGHGQASKNHKLLKQAQRASLLKHAVQEVGRDAIPRNVMDYKVRQDRAPELESEDMPEDCIDDQFERDVGQSEDFQNFLNKYMQQKQRQAEKKVKDNFLELERCEYGPSPALAQQENAPGRMSKGPIVQQRQKSSERASSLAKSRSQKRKATKPMPLAAGLAVPESIQPLHPLRSASDANLVKDLSTGRLLRKLNSNNVPLEKIYGAGTLAKNRKTMSTPKYRPLDKQRLSRAGSRSSRAEERLAELGFPKHQYLKSSFQKQTANAVDQDGEEDDELPSVDDEYQGLGKNIRERQNQNYEALKRDVSARKVLPAADAPEARPERHDQKQQQRIVHAAYAGVANDGESKPQRVHRSENREQPQPLQKQMRPFDQQALGAAESQRTFKELSLLPGSKNDASMPKLAQMRLTSANAAKTSFRQSKPSSSRKLKRPESPGTAAKQIISSLPGKQRDKISVYPTQRTQPSKPTADVAAQQGKRPQGSLYASSELYLNTERPMTQKRATEKSVHSQPRKGPGRTPQLLNANKAPEKSTPQGAFGPRASRDQQQPAKTVKTDRASSANLKIPGGSINIKVDAAVANEYTAAEADKNSKDEPNLQPKEKGPTRQWSKGPTSSAYTAPQLQKKRGSAAAALGSYRPNSLTDSARGSSTTSGPGVYAKMIRAQAQTAASARSRAAAASSSTSARGTYATRSKQQPQAQPRTASRRESSNSQKDKRQLGEKSGSLGAGSLLSPSVLQGQYAPLPSQKPGGRPGDPRQPHPRAASRGATTSTASNAKKAPIRTSAKVHAALANASKRKVQKPTIFSVNTSEQR